MEMENAGECPAECQVAPAAGDLSISAGEDRALFNRGVGLGPQWWAELSNFSHRHWRGAPKQDRTPPEPPQFSNRCSPNPGAQPQHSIERGRDREHPRLRRKEVHPVYPPLLRFLRRDFTFIPAKIKRRPGRAVRCLHLYKTRLAGCVEGQHIVACTVALLPGSSWVYSL